MSDTSDSAESQTVQRSWLQSLGSRFVTLPLWFSCFRKHTDFPRIITSSPIGLPLSRSSSHLSAYLCRSLWRWTGKSLWSLFPLGALRQRRRLLRRGRLGPSWTICAQSPKRQSKKYVAVTFTGKKNSIWNVKGHWLSTQTSLWLIWCEQKLQSPSNSSSTYCFKNVCVQLWNSFVALGRCMCVWMVSLSCVHLIHCVTGCRCFTFLVGAWEPEPGCSLS